MLITCVLNQKMNDSTIRIQRLKKCLVTTGQKLMQKNNNYGDSSF